jgi:hypothetical protein
MQIRRDFSFAGFILSFLFASGIFAMKLQTGIIYRHRIGYLNSDPEQHGTTSVA